MKIRIKHILVVASVLWSLCSSAQYTIEDQDHTQKQEENVIFKKGYLVMNAGLYFNSASMYEKLDYWSNHEREFGIPFIFNIDYLFSDYFSAGLFWSYRSVSVNYTDTSGANYQNDIINTYLGLRANIHPISFFQKGDFVDGSVSRSFDVYISVLGAYGGNFGMFYDLMNPNPSVSGDLSFEPGAAAGIRFAAFDNVGGFVEGGFIEGPYISVGMTAAIGL